MTDKDRKTIPGSCDWIPGQGREETAGNSCDWTAVAPPQEGDNCSALYRFQGGYSWEGVKSERYKDEEGSWSSIGRQVLIGNRRESTRFDLRYFEIAPGGYSSLEKHRHEHVVIGIRGRGQALLGGEIQEIGFLDTAYVAPGDPHQLLNPHEEPFGFFCIVNHERDRPAPLDKEELASLLASAAGIAIRP